MVGMGLSEIAIIFMMLGFQDNLGVPLGVPPAEEIQLMSDVAPESCLFYASWATAGKPDPEKNPSERWFAQAKIQAGWTRIQTTLLHVGSKPDDSDGIFADIEFEQPCEKELAALVTQLAGQALARATALFVENGERFDSLSGGCVIHLEPAAVDRIVKSIAALKDALPPDWKPREFKIEDNTYLAFTIPDSPAEISFGLRGQFAIIGVGPDSIAKIDQKVRSPEPAWLADLKKRLPVQRRSSISHIEIGSLIKLMEKESWWIEAGPVVKDILRLESLVAFESVCGLDEHGFLSRHRLTIDGKTPVGLASIFDPTPLAKSDWESLAAKRDFSGGIRLSIDNLLALIKPLIELDGISSLEEQTKQFQSMFGIDLQEDVLDHMDGTVLIQGNFDSGNPTGGWLVQFGIDDEMSFFDSYQIFHEKLAEVLNSSGDGSKLVTEEKDGIQVYWLDYQDPFGGFMPKPRWCLHGGKLCIALDEETLNQRLEAKEQTLASDTRLQQVLAQAEQAGLGQPLTISRTDMASAIKLLMSFSSMFGMAMEGAPFQLSDLPPTEILVNGLEPSVSLTFRTDDGFEMFSRQTIPSAAPGATVAAIAVMTAPASFQVRATAKQTDSKNRMRQMAIALHDYHDAYTALPAQFNQDKAGKPLLSWRVHILPFMEQSELYEQFHLDEPWDSEHNIKLVEKMPADYGHPKLKLEPGHTAYVGIEGKDTIWESPKNDKESPIGLNLEELSSKDGTSGTGMLIEVTAEHSIIWTKPDDFEIDQDGFAEKLKAVWPNGLNVAMGDASVHTFRADLSEKQWRDLFGVRDGNMQDLQLLRSNR